MSKCVVGDTAIFLALYSVVLKEEKGKECSHKLLVKAIKIFQLFSMFSKLLVSRAWTKTNR